MRATLVRLTLPTVIALTTAALGWWSVPIVGGIWGLLRLSERPVAVAAASGALAWGVLLLIMALTGPITEVADRVAGMFGLPGIALVLITLFLAAALAGSAAGLGDSLSAGPLARRAVPETGRGGRP